jgi:hypothetical protein
VAQHTEVRLVDDLDGSDAVETVTFAVDGKALEIDLSEAHAAKLRDVFAPFVAAARRAGGSAAPGRSPGATAAAPKRDVGEARAWLLASGYPVKDRGRLPEPWLADFEAKSPNPPTAQAAEAKPKAGRGRKKQDKHSAGAVEQGTSGKSAAVDDGKVVQFRSA